MADETLSFCDDGAEHGMSRADAQLFLLLRADVPSAGSVRYPLAEVDTIALGRGQTLSARFSSKHHLAITVPDGWMSSKHAQLSRIQGRWIVEDLGSKNGTLLRGQRVSRAALADGDLFECGQSFFLFRDAVTPLSTIAASQDRAALSPPQPALATFVKSQAEAFDSIARVANSTVPIMILGETGSGKEVVARAAHALSERKGNFVAVNCGALPEHLVESELFGARKGAYSGATEDRMGLIRAADGGTLFLDEIGDLPFAAQVSFLRVLQEKVVVPVGGTEPVPVDFRLVVATHRDLEAAVAREEFREDLMARISGLTVRLSPLRERREDLGLLIESLLVRMANDPSAISFTVKGARALLSYDFPQNVRELERALELAVALAGPSPIDASHLPESIQKASTEDLSPPEDAPELSGEDQSRRDELIALLQQHDGNVAAVSRVMGKARMQIHRWLRRYGINPSDFRA
jgi:DNA-binding NtrC family response regulator